MQKDHFQSHTPLADMHGDGVYFNKRLKDHPSPDSKQKIKDKKKKVG